MKDFWKNVGATIVGMLILCIIAGLFGLFTFIGALVSGNDKPAIAKNSVLVLQLDGEMEEGSSQPSIRDYIQGNIESTPGFTETLSAIKKARNNNKISGIYIESNDFHADMAQLEELRKALLDFKKAGKWIIAYGEAYGQGAYYLASAADKIYINPSGEILWAGMGGKPYYLKDAFAKAGIKFVAFKCGKYKSAVENFTENSMSAPAREQAERYIQGMWDTMTAAVSKSRGISVDSLNSYADRFIALEPTENLKKYKFVDGLIYNDSIKGIIKKQLGIDADATIHQVSVSTMAAQDDSESGDKIAVYNMWGDIVGSRVPVSMGGGHSIAQDQVCQDLQDLADDDDVKAVVLRVNSGGGDAYASEQIWHEVMMLKKKKPVVISMSGAAASGAYYLSTAANWIVADPTTITGSIGIFGLFPDMSGLIQGKFGVHFDSVKTNRNSDFLEDGTFTPEQAQLMQASINHGYWLFKSRVAEGRKLSMARVEEIAQGHVYLASDAIKIGLVDQLGGLDDAVKKAAQLAKSDDYHEEFYPGEQSLLDQLLAAEDQNAGNFLDEQARNVLGDYYTPMRILMEAQRMKGIQARLPFIFKVN